MYRFRRDGVSVISVLDSRHVKKNGLYPVKTEVVFRRRQKYYPTGIDVSIEEWESLWYARRMPEKAIYIEKSFNHIRRIVNELIDQERFSFDILENRLGHAHITVNQAVANKMDEAFKLGKINTFYRYRNTLHALETFAGKRITFDSITPVWLRRCEKFWMSKGKSSTTVNIYMRSLRCVMNDAIGYGVIRPVDSPFGTGKYRIPVASKRRMALTKEDIIAIRNWKGDDRSEYWRDMWLFSYLCNGINFRDMLFLRRSSIIDGEIVFMRSKTNSLRKEPKPIRATLLEEMVDIIERRGNGIEGSKDGMLFMHANGNETPQETINIVRNAISSCNAAMKTIAEDIGIEHVSTYTARHSYATVLMKSGVDITFISESLGHSSIRMTETYLGLYDKEERAEHSRKLLEL